MSSGTDKQVPLKRTGSHLDDGQDAAKKPMWVFGASNRLKILNSGEDELIGIKKDLERIQELATISLSRVANLQNYPNQAQKRSEAQRRVQKPVKRPQTRNKTTSRATKESKQTMPTDDQNESNDPRIMQEAPPSDDSTVERLLNDVVSKEPQQPSHGEEKDMFLACMWILEILQKLRGNPSKFLNEMSLVAQAVEVGQDGYQPTRIFYLDLAPLDTWSKLKQEDIPVLRERLNALAIDKEKSDKIPKTLRQKIQQRKYNCYGCGLKLTCNLEYKYNVKIVSGRYTKGSAMSCHNSRLKTTSISHIRLLANMEHRVSRHHVVEHNIPKIVTDILNEKQITPKFSGQLLLGTVKLYKRKMDHLLRDCSEVISKLQLTFRQDSLCIRVYQDQTIGDLKTVDLSAPVDLEAAFGQTAPLPGQLFTLSRDTHSDVDYDIANWSPDLWCDRDEPCEKPQLLPGDIEIDIGDSMFPKTIELRTEPPDSENEYPWFGQEDQSSGSVEDFQALDPPFSSKRTRLELIDEASAPAKRRHSSQRNVLADDITVLAPLSDMVSEEILLPRNPKLRYIFKFDNHSEWAPEVRPMLSLEWVRKIGNLKHNDEELEADEVRNSAKTESQHQTQMTLDGAADHGFPNGSWIGDTDDDSNPVTPVSNATVAPRKTGNEGLLQALDFLKSQLGMLEENTAVRFEDLVPYSTGKAVASVNFLAALTLATMGSLKIDQEQEGHSEHRGLVAGASFRLPS